MVLIKYVGVLDRHYNKDEVGYRAVLLVRRVSAIRIFITQEVPRDARLPVAAQEQVV